MTAIIFGANGQDGYYLQEICRQKKIKSIGVSRSGPTCHRGDVSCYGTVAQLFKQVLPTYIFHFAAHSTTRHDALFDNHASISTGTLNILEAARKHCPAAKVFIVGSGLQFVNTGSPISENDPFEAQSPYAVARIQAVYAARYYRRLGLRAYVGYLFHHDSPHRRPQHVSKLIASAAKRIATGSKETIELGDISVEKEWSFAGDIVQGIFTLIDQEAVFECVIGSGKAYSIAQWIELCFNSIDRDWRPHVRTNDAFCAEYKRLVSDPRTITRLGWRPTVDISELAAMMVKTS